MKSRLFLIITLIPLIIGCRNKPQSSIIENHPSIIGKWRVVMDLDSFHRNRPNYIEKRYLQMDTTTYSYVQETRETKPYIKRGDTIFTRLNSDTSKIDTTILKMINNDSILVIVKGEAKALGYKDWYMIREK